MKCSMGENSIMEGHVICNNTYGVNVFHPNGLGAQKGTCIGLEAMIGEY